MQNQDHDNNQSQNENPDRQTNGQDDNSLANSDLPKANQDRSIAPLSKEEVKEVLIKYLQHIAKVADPDEKIISIGASGPLSAKDLLDEVNNQTEIGEYLIDIFHHGNQVDPAGFRKRMADFI